VLHHPDAAGIHFPNHGAGGTGGVGGDSSPGFWSGVTWRSHVLPLQRCQMNPIFPVIHQRMMTHHLGSPLIIHGSGMSPVEEMPADIEVENRILMRKSKSQDKGREDKKGYLKGAAADVPTVERRRKKGLLRGRRGKGRRRKRKRNSLLGPRG